MLRFNYLIIYACNFRCQFVCKPVCLPVSVSYAFNCILHICGNSSVSVGLFIHTMVYIVLILCYNYWIGAHLYVLNSASTVQNFFVCLRCLHLKHSFIFVHVNVVICLTRVMLL